MFERVRDTLLRAITSPRGDSLAAVRIPKDLARRLNATLGQPLATRDEITRRARARARLAELRGSSVAGAATKTEAAPVLVYFEKDRNVRELTRIEELLGARSIAWKRLDLAGDEATTEFVTRMAKCERDDLPVVFVGDRAVGGYTTLVEADVSGELARLVGGP
jgi:glutaredoxin/antitoxin component of MazEF toxin-antitoxin module